MSSVLEKVASSENLMLAFYRAKKSSWPRNGVDARQFINIWRNWEGECERLQHELLQGKYEYTGADAVLIPGKKKHRGIYKTSVRDRWVQYAVHEVVKSAFPLEFWSSVSYGRRSCPEDDRSIRALTGKMKALISQNNLFVYETDIQDFFPSIDKEIVVAMVLKELKDDSLSPLLGQMVSTEIARYIGKADRYKDLWNSETGVPQGGVLSPLFANVYLNDFDRWLEDQGWISFRYVDDLVVFCASSYEAVRASEKIPTKLSELNLSVHPLVDPGDGSKMKTFLRKPGESIKFVGINISKTSRKPSRDSVDKLLKNVASFCEGEEKLLTLLEVLTRTNNLLEGWIAAYRFCDLTPGYLRQIDRSISHSVGKYMVGCGLIERSGILQDQSVHSNLGLVQLADLFRRSETEDGLFEEPDLDSIMGLIDPADMFTSGAPK